MEKSMIIRKILAVFESGLFIKILSVFEAGLWIAGIILANIFIILIAIILIVVVEIPIVYINRDNLKEIFHRDGSAIVEDERTQMINEKAATMTFGTFIAVIVYIGIIIVALRNSYPQLLVAAYTLFLAAFFCFILYFASRAYYSRKY